MSSSMKTFKIGIIGSGRIARVHCLALKFIPNVQTHGVTSHISANAEKFAQELGIPKVYQSIEEMCADPEIDAIHICNINTAHDEALQKAIAANKAVICEKPLCVSTAEIEKILQLTAHKMVHTCFIYRFHFAAQALRKHIQQHGAPKALKINYHQASWLRKQPWQPDQNIYGKSYVLSDIGVHTIDIATFLLGEDLTFEKAQVFFSGEKYQCSDIAAELHLLSTKKTEVHLSISKNNTQHDTPLFIQALYGDHTVTIPELMQETVVLEKNSEKQFLSRTAHTDIIDVLGFPAGHLEGWLCGFINFFFIFYQQPEGGSSFKGLLPTIEESLKIQRLIDKVFENGDWQAL